MDMPSQDSCAFQATTGALQLRRKGLPSKVLQRQVANAATNGQLEAAFDDEDEEQHGSVVIAEAMCEQAKEHGWFAGTHSSDAYAGTGCA